MVGWAALVLGSGEHTPLATRQRAGLRTMREMREMKSTGYATLHELQGCSGVSAALRTPVTAVQWAGTGSGRSRSGERRDWRDGEARCEICTGMHAVERMVAQIDDCVCVRDDCGVDRAPARFSFLYFDGTDVTDRQG